MCISKAALTNRPLEIILASLRFRGMEHYRRRPLETYPGTYRWMLDDSTSNDTYDPCAKQKFGFENAARWQHGNNFRKWLTSSDGTFWITGKPGAGKSCLMKYLFEHQRTKELLQTWAGENVVLAGFLF